ncbi:MAG: hypothetical protein ACTSRU_21325, partial [Candidatus Hodarchaeales archaeon]
MLVIFILIVPLILFFQIIPYQSTATFSVSEEIIQWDKNLKGDIYSFTITETGDTTYSKVGEADGNGTVTVEWYNVLSNQTLIIKPGVKIIIESRFSNDFWGEVQAMGTEEEPIRITTKERDNGQTWFNADIWIRELAGSEIDFSHCIFKHINLKIDRDTRFVNCGFIESGEIDLEILMDRSKILKSVEIINCDFVDIDNFGVTSENVICKGNFFEDFFQVVIYADDELFVSDNSLSNGSSNFRVVYNGTKEGKMKNNNIYNSSSSVFGPMRVSNNYFNGSVSIKKDVTFEENVVDETILFNLLEHPKEVVDNHFHGNVEYNNYDEEQQETLDISYNHWGIDWEVEIRVGMNWTMERPEPLDPLNLYEYHNISVDFEPYYDKNGTKTDDDGLRNWWEIQQGFSIYLDNSEDDPDEDGLPNSIEFDIGLDPLSPDSDSDGMPDGWEYEHELDPLNPWDFDDDEEEKWKYNDIDTGPENISEG